MLQTGRETITKQEISVRIDGNVKRGLLSEVPRF